MKARAIHLVFVGFLVATLGVATAWSVTTEEPTSAFVPSGVGAVPLVEDAEEQGLETLRLLSGPLALETDPDHDPTHTLLVVVNPQRSFQADEVEAVRQFLVDGGKVMVADDFGQANSLTSPLGVTFERVRLVLPEGIDHISASVEGRDMGLQMDGPTALRVSSGVDHDVIATAPSGSFLDRDGNGIIGAGDPVGSFVVAAAVDVGVRGGRLVAVADPAPLLAATGDQADNPTFREALLDNLLPAGGRMVVDESRDPTSDPWLLAAAAVTGALTGNPWRFVAGALAIGVSATGIVVVTGAPWSLHRFLPDRFIRRNELPSEGKTAEDSTVISSDPHGTRAHWTTRGRAALYGGIPLALFGIMIGNRQATTAAALLLLAGALALWTRPLRIEARRRLSATRAPEDSTVHVRLDLTARSRGRGTVEVLDALPQEFRLSHGHNWFRAHLTPMRRLDCPYQLTPAIRGPYTVGPLRVRRSDPFRLRMVQFQATAPQELMVHPRHDPLTRIPFQSKVAAPTLGPHLVNRAGDGSEFHALRDYMAGDSIRSINWKASARSREFIVNQRVHESMSTITIFIDARAVSAAGSVRSSPLNESCRVALSIATGAVQARDRVKVFAYGDGVTDIALGKGSEQIHNLTRALAELEAKGSTSFREAIGSVLPDLRPRMPFILLSGFEGDDSVVDGLRTLRQRGIIPTVFAMPIGTDPVSDDDLPEPDADRLQTDHETAVTAIRGMSVPVFPVVPNTPLTHILQVGVS